MVSMQEPLKRTKYRELPPPEFKHTNERVNYFKKEYPDIYEELRQYAKENDRKILDVAAEAISIYLAVKERINIKGKGEIKCGSKE